MKTRSNAAGEEQSSPFLFPATESEDQDTGNLSTGVDEDALDADDLDTDQITATP